MAIAVWRINEAEYWAGETLESCIKEAVRVTGLSRDEAFDEDWLECLDENDLNEYILHKDDGDVSFREEIEILISEGVPFPALIAVTPGYE